MQRKEERKRETKIENHTERGGERKRKRFSHRIWISPTMFSLSFFSTFFLLFPSSFSFSFSYLLFNFICNRTALIVWDSRNEFRAVQALDSLVLHIYESEVESKRGFTDPSHLMYLYQIMTRGCSVISRILCSSLLFLSFNLWNEMTLLWSDWCQTFKKSISVYWPDEWVKHTHTHSRSVATSSYSFMPYFTSHEPIH